MLQSVRLYSHIVRLKERSRERGKTDGNKRESNRIIEKDKKMKITDMQERMRSKESVNGENRNKKEHSLDAESG